MPAALYLAILRFIGRDYLAVLRLAELCVSEAVPTPEEAQLWDALAHACSLDPSPDATAVRVKLMLMVKDTPIEPRLALKWPPVADVLNYVNCWSYISANCRLTDMKSSPRSKAWLRRPWQRRKLPSSRLSLVSCSPAPRRRARRI